MGSVGLLTRSATSPPKEERVEAGGLSSELLLAAPPMLPLALALALALALLLALALALALALLLKESTGSTSCSCKTCCC